MSVDPLFALLAAVWGLSTLLLCWWKGERRGGYLEIPDLLGVERLRRSLRERGARVPYYLLWLAFIGFLLAFADPHRDLAHARAPSQELPARGLAIYLVLDRSSSMAQETQARDAWGRSTALSKMTALKELTRAFLLGDRRRELPGRPSDMVGVVAFARSAEVLTPLTLDHEAVARSLERLDIVRSRESDGTAIGYALYKTIHLLAATRHYSALMEAPPYTIEDSVILLVTDGLHSPHPEDRDEERRAIAPRDAAAYAKEQGIRLYIVNVEPRIAEEALAFFRHEMEAAAEMTGGRFFHVDAARGLEEIYREIDTLEKGRLPLRERPREALRYRVSAAPYLIAVALALAAISLLLAVTLWRRVA